MENGASLGRRFRNGTAATLDIDGTETTGTMGTPNATHTGPFVVGGTYSRAAYGSHIAVECLYAMTIDRALTTQERAEWIAHVSARAGAV